MIEEVINPIFKPLYNVYLDGNFIGMVEEEDYPMPNYPDIL